MSQGNYDIINDKLILTDKFNDYVQQYLIRNNMAEGLITFRPFINKRFKINYIDEKSNTTFIGIEKRRTENKTIENSTYQIKYGKYGGYLMSLLITRPDKYIFSILNTVVSEGNFSQQDNELILIDEYTGYKFYFFITNNGVVENITPVGEILSFD